jgi:CRP/FNR family cyclic AMP-dependent transcriptional regulator
VNTNLSTDYSQFLSHYPLKHYPKGSVLISPNEELDYMYFLESGDVRKYDVNKYGDQIVMNIFSAPILFPLSWALNRTPNRYYFEALSSLTARPIPTDELTAYLKSDPSMVYALLQQVYSGLENSQRRVVYLTHGSVRSRLLFELLIEARRSGEEQQDGSYILNVSESEIAQRAGLSRETISREIAKLVKSSDLCKRVGRSIMIQDLHELDEMLRRTETFERTRNIDRTT